MNTDHNPQTRSSNYSQNETNRVTLDSNQVALASKQVAHTPGNEPIITNPFLNKLTHSVGHDLRSPMFVIRSYAQLLQKNEDKDRLDRGLKMIGDATVKMEKIIDGLVQLIDTYTIAVPEYEILDFQKVFEDVQLLLCNEIEQFKPKFIVDFTTSNSVDFSAAYLKEMMATLIDNAMRHNADNKDLIIKINTTIVNNKTVLSIIDNGKNEITPKEMNKLKDPFYSYTEDQSCAGMGLSKVEAIAQKTNCKFIIEKPYNLEIMVCKFVFS